MTDRLSLRWTILGHISDSNSLQLPRLPNTHSFADSLRADSLVDPGLEVHHINILAICRTRRIQGVMSRRLVQIDHPSRTCEVRRMFVRLQSTTSPDPHILQIHVLPTHIPKYLRPHSVWRILHRPSLYAAEDPGPHVYIHVGIMQRPAGRTVYPCCGMSLACSYVRFVIPSHATVMRNAPLSSSAVSRVISSTRSVHTNSIVDVSLADLP